MRMSLTGIVGQDPDDAVVNGIGRKGAWTADDREAEDLFGHGCDGRLFGVNETPGPYENVALSRKVRGRIDCDGRSLQGGRGAGRCSPCA